MKLLYEPPPYETGFFRYNCLIFCEEYRTNLFRILQYHSAIIGERKRVGRNTHLKTLNIANEYGIQFSNMSPVPEPKVILHYDGLIQRSHIATVGRYDLISFVREILNRDNRVRLFSLHLRSQEFIYDERKPYKRIMPSWLKVMARRYGFGFETLSFNEVLKWKPK